LTTLNELMSTLKLIPREDYHPFPQWGEAFELKTDYAPAAEKIAEEPVLALPATRFMDFQRNGNRSRFEKLVSDNRIKMLTLALAEMQEAQGRFIDPLIDRIWAMCEESTWCIPAALNQYPTVDCTEYELPDLAEYTYIDLSAGYSGATLALILYMLRKPLEKESPVLVRRIELELEKRIIQPYLGTDKMWWMTLDTTMKPNNWNPWVNSNVLTAALLAVSDEEKRLQVARKALMSAQKFVDHYPADGGCDEGPTYFGVAGACLLDLCQIIDEARCDGGDSAYSIDKLSAIAGYIMHMHIADDLYVNFADAVPHVCPPVGVLLRAAQALGDRNLEAFARSCPQGKAALGYSNPYRLLTDFLHPVTPGDDISQENGWYFAGIQVCTGRTDRLFFAAKGGHNVESHNHNDVGNYILYCDGEPVVVDIGPTEYTRATFSAERWTIPTFLSPYHNTLIPNGAQQPPIREAEARNVVHSDDGQVLTFQLEMAGAYPEEKTLQSFVRTFTLDRAAGTLTIAETAKGENLVMPIILRKKPALAEGRVDLGKVELLYDPGELTATAEEFELYDQRQKNEWGQETMWRVLLSRKEGGSWKYTYRIAD